MASHQSELRSVLSPALSPLSLFSSEVPKAHSNFSRRKASLTPILPLHPSSYPSPSWLLSCCPREESDKEALAELVDGTSFATSTQADDPFWWLSQRSRDKGKHGVQQAPRCLQGQARTHLADLLHGQQGSEEKELTESACLQSAIRAHFQA